ncbi:hypothetical protein D7X33_41300, partial [Butyricicoccus sp. 1XD8-22]
MQMLPFIMKEKLKGGVHLQSHEEQICYILRMFDKLFLGEKLSFYRFSPVGYVGEGVAMLVDGQL